MALSVADRVLTIVATATVTSAAWIVFGSVSIERMVPAQAAQAPEQADPAPAAAPEASDAPLVQAGALTMPVRGVRASQLLDTFTDVRGGGDRAHHAIDIPAPAGTPVIAAAAGTVESLFRSDAGGNTIYVRSPDRRTIHYYAHLQNYAQGIDEGQEVRAGQRLGFVGSSGNADPAAPHLHFAVVRIAPDANWWDDGAPVNPYGLLGGR